MKNWAPNMTKVKMEDVPRDANIIGSHFVYKVKTEFETVDGKNEQHLKLKSSLCVHGNKDSERESLHTDAAVVSHMGFRILYSIACMKGMTNG